MNEPRSIDELLDGLIERTRRPWAEARWGALGAVLLGLAVPLAWIAGGGLLTALFMAAGVRPEAVSYRYAIVGMTQLVLLLAAFGGAAMAGAGPRALGLRGPLAGPVLRGALLGAGALVLAMAWDFGLRAAWPEAGARLDEELARQMAALSGPLPLLLLFALVVAPLGEETFFRGFFFAGLRRVLPFPVAALISAIVFAAVHLMPWSSPQLVAVGLLAAWTYERERTLAGPLALHASFNGLSLLYSLAAAPSP